MRVTGGRLGGRRLRAPREGARPTADRVREALFARLDCEGARVLDLFAGSGALGIEALSRGAREAVFVERAPRCLAVLRENLAALALGGAATVVRGEALRALRRFEAEGRRFDLVLLDPPYASDDAARSLQALGRSELLADGAIVVVESSRRRPPPAVEGLEALDERRYGDTLVRRLRASARGAGRSEPSMQRGRGEPTIALFPASFDPLTNGHLDILRRSLRAFGEIVVAVAVNLEKRTTFTLEERIEMLQAVVGSERGVRITSFSGLTVDFAREIGAQVVIRGLRAIADFEYEFEMALMNKHLNAEVETVFLMSSQEYLYVSSSRLKELVRFGRDISEFVPPLVAKRLREKLGAA